MINVGELRIGDFISCKYKDGIHKICSILKNESYAGGYELHVLSGERISIDYATPILITEDMLSQCGFYKVGATFGIKMEAVMYHKSMDGYCLSLLDELGLMLCHCSSCEYSEYDEIMPLCGVNYLHELQNLCFNLTGKELEMQL